MSASVTEHFGPDYRQVSVGDVMIVAKDQPLRLDCGKDIDNFPLAYQTHGTLNADKSNAILIFHGLSGDQYIYGTHPVTGKPGWWEGVVGPGCIFDTERFFIICCNTLGGCMGSFGPKSINPETGKSYSLDFPVITIGDMVRAQGLLIEQLGIEKLFAVVGGSMGGMMALDWAARFPDRSDAVILIAAATHHSAQNIAFHEIGRQAIMADTEWDQGDYLNKKSFPKRGLAVSRMTAHVTYVSEPTLQRKFGRGLQDRHHITYGFDADFQVESYLRHQGMTFVERFDPNSYLYITRAMDYFDLAGDYDGQLANAFKKAKSHFCVISFSSDWLFPSEESKKIVYGLHASDARVSFVEVETDKGHDAFLLDEPEFHHVLEGFITHIAKEKGI